jgi:spore germination protein GerM
MAQKVKDKKDTKDKAKTQPVKKTAAKKAPAKKMPVKDALPPAAPRRTPAAMFVLVIMVLLTVIAFLLLRKGREPVDPSPQARTEQSHSPERALPEGPKAKGQAREQRKEQAKKPASAKAGSADKRDVVDKKAADAAADKRVGVQVWFLRFNEKTERVSLAPVKRSVLHENRVESALRELIEGPSAGEKGKDYLTAVPPALRLKGVKLRNRVAELDFDSALGEGATGTILMNRVDQIIYTATQFDDVDGVTITINGRRQSTIGSDGLSIQGTLSRK